MTRVRIALASDHGKDAVPGYHEMTVVPNAGDTFQEFGADGKAWRVVRRVFFPSADGWEQMTLLVEPETRR